MLAVSAPASPDVPSVNVRFAPTDAERAAMLDAMARWAPNLRRGMAAWGASELSAGAAVLVGAVSVGETEAGLPARDVVAAAIVVLLAGAGLAMRTLALRRSILPAATIAAVAEEPEIELTIGPDGLELRAPVCRSVAWKDVASVRRDGDLLVFTFTHDAPLALPRRAIAEDAEVSLWAALERKFVGVRGLVRGSGLATSIVNADRRA